MQISRVNNTSGLEAAGPARRVSKEAQQPKVAPEAKLPAEPMGTDAATNDLNPRLAAYAAKIENRFDQAMSKMDLSPRQQGALEKAKEQFGALIERFDAAYFDGSEAPGKSAKDGLNALMAHFSGMVNHIANHGKAPTQDVPDPAMEADVASLMKDDKTSFGSGIDTHA
jgi:hypothetical protein